MKKEMRSELNRAIKSAKTPETAPKTSAKLFKPKDVFKTDNKLTRLLWGLCILRGITVWDLDVGLRKRIRTKSWPKSKFSPDKTNIGSAMTKDSVTFNKVIELLEDILGYDVDISIHLTDKSDGSTSTYRQSEVVRAMADLINAPPKTKKRGN